MSDPTEHARLSQYKGAIAWMSRNSVAANLLMLVLVLGGLLSMFRVQQEVFPEFDLDYINITVPYPGATPEQTEEIVSSIEQAVADTNGVKKMFANASEAVASVTLEVATDADANKVLSDVENAVNRITTFPERAEEAQISLMENKREVISLVFYGEPYEKPLNGVPEGATALDRAFVAVTVEGGGDSPLAIQAVVDALKRRLGRVADVARVDAVRAPSGARVVARFQPDVAFDAARARIERAVAAMETLPARAHAPRVEVLATVEAVRAEVMYDVASERVLKQIAEEARTALKADPEISQVELFSTRPPEVAVEISQARLREHGLTHEQVALAIRAGAAEIAGGAVKTPSGEKLVRSRPRPSTGEEFADLPLRRSELGGNLTVGDVADQVEDGFVETDQSASYNGRPAVMLKVFRTGDQTPVSVAGAVHAYVDAKRAELPEGIGLATWFDWSEMYNERLELMLKNAFLGFLLVLIVLGLFLEMRVAFWVTLGIPISFLGAILLMPTMDVSINMLSMFAFIVTLGIVVDDAIVVGEAIYSKKQEGHSFAMSAILGAKEVKTAVVFSVLTTVVAFMPMLMVPGVSGKFFQVIPMIVISVLMVSLFESFFILPAHLGHTATPRPLWQRMLGFGLLLAAISAILMAVTGALPPPRGALIGLVIGALVPLAIPIVAGFFGFFRKFVSRGLELLIERVYDPVLRSFMAFRYVALAGSVALCMIAVGTCESGRLPFTFMPAVESDIVMVQADLPFGAPVAETRQVEASLVKAAQQVAAKHGGDAVVRGIFSQVGSGLPSQGPFAAVGAAGGHLANVQILLVPSAERTVTAAQFVREWRERVGELASVRTISYIDSIGPTGGKPIAIRLVHSDRAVLEVAAAELVEHLEAIDGVIDLDPGFQPGKPQLEFDVNALGRSLGLSADEVGRQVRAHFFGAEALRQQRGLDELKVMVRLPESDRRSEAAIRDLMLRTPQGKEVPFDSVATMSRSRGPTSIRRQDEQRAIEVTGDIDRTVTTPDQVYPVLVAEDGALTQLLAKHKGLSYDFEGERREQMESMGSLMTNGVLALIIIFALIAIPFRSYIQPFVVMFAIPLGLVSAVFGHLMMGYDLSLISAMGMIALSGVVINDSLVLVDYANQVRRDDPSLSAWDAMVRAGKRRFRPIVLTSLTTFFGLMPMIFETSMQARFLIPMAISLGFGIILALPMLLVVVPSLYIITDDLQRLFRPKQRAATPEEGPSDDVATVPV